MTGRSSTASRWAGIGNLCGRLALAAVVVAVVLSFFGGLGAHTGGTVPSPTAVAPTTPLSAAENSLARGEGPAHGLPMGCSSAGQGASCSSTSTHPASAGSSVGWGNITGRESAAPIPRSYGRSMAFDPTDNYVVLFGGYTGGGYENDTWEFAHSTWTQLSPASHPADRDHSTLVWDAIDGYLLLFGGSNENGQLYDTWSFINGNWTQHAPSNHPSGRWSASMAYDAADGYVVLFGGCSSSVEQSDTWEYLAGTWTPLSPSPHPAARGDAGMTYDPAASAVLLFGGDNSYIGSYNDTWEFHAGGWSQLNLSVTPSARTSPAFAFDPWLGGVVLFGGDGASGVLGDTWLFANGLWAPVATASPPEPRYFGIMATDPADGYLLLFGGEGFNLLNDTWVLYTISATANSTVSSGAAPLGVTFSANATDPFSVSSFSWAFGDGGTATGASVVYVYNHAGYFLPTVTVTDVNGVTASATLVESVLPSLGIVAVISADHGVAPLTVTFSALATGGTVPYSWEWSVNSLRVASTQNASYTFALAGSYSVAATVRDAASAHQSQTFLVSVSAAPPPALVAHASASTLAGEAPLQVAFTATAQGGATPYAYSWNFGDGTGGIGANPVHTYTGFGVFTVSLVATDAQLQTASTTLVVNVTAAVSVTAVVSTTGGHAPLNVTFDGRASGGVSPVYFLWTFGDGQSGTGEVVSHTFTKAGSFIASVEIVDSVGHYAFTNVSITVSAGTPAVPPPVSSSGASPAFDSTTVAVAAELGATGVAVALLVLLFRRRR